MQVKADTFAADLRPVLDELTDLSANAAAAELTRRGYPTPRGGKWTAGKVINVRARLVSGGYVEPPGPETDREAFRLGATLAAR